MLHRIILLLLVLPSLAFAQMTPPTVAARAWVLLDVGSGQVLTAEQPDQRIEPASLTKADDRLPGFLGDQEQDPEPGTDGTGYWGPPKRFGAPSEITLLRLVPA